jgi:uncharacterized protein (TIGR03118 family)
MLRHKSTGCAAASAILLLGLHSAIAASYVQTNLASDIPGLAANTDPFMQNPWGMSFSPTSPIWMSDQGSGVATLHTGNGTQAALVVTIPGSNPTGNPTGTVFNGTPAFQLPNGAPALFLFSTLNGQIAGWNSGTTAVTTFTATDGAVYTGLTSGAVGGNGFLYAADLAGQKIDVFSSTFAKTTLSGSFTDPTLPSGYRPYNIQNVGGKLYVEYATIDPVTHLPSHAANQGIVSVFDLNGNFLQRLVTNANLDSPWGITLASSNFGQFSNDLLIGNNGDGTIDAFDPISGAFLGKLLDSLGNPLTNSGLWALAFRTGAPGFDPNTLFFTAGINGEADGLFGAIQVAATPLPAAFPLFGTVIAAFGALIWRRTRKVRTATAASN